MALLGGTERDLVHNHHNFAWKEEHDGEEMIVVRKGATPAFPHQRGFVGGSTGDASVILEGASAPGLLEAERRAPGAGVDRARAAHPDAPHRVHGADEDAGSVPGLSRRVAARLELARVDSNHHRRFQRPVSCH